MPVKRGLAPRLRLKRSLLISPDVENTKVAKKEEQEKAEETTPVNHPNDFSAASARAEACAVQAGQTSTAPRSDEGEKEELQRVLGALLDSQAEQQSEACSVSLGSQLIRTA